MTQSDGDNLSNLVPVTFIYDAALGSPIETQPYGGKVVAVSRNEIPLPRRGKFLGQNGFSRQTAGAWEWVMQGDVDPVDQFVDSLTGKGGWINQQSRTVIKTLVQRLFSAGIPRGTINTQVPQMYQAVAAEIIAEQQAG
jgi:hypothetical protein